MADPFVAEIRIVGFNFAPTRWAQCNGQIMPISQNTALYALLGTIYGGNGQSTFALPNLQGRAPMHPGYGPGLSGRSLGEVGGTTSVELLQSEIPFHTHTAYATPRPASTNNAAGQYWGRVSKFYNTPTELVGMSPQALGVAGSSAPHNNMQPYLAINFIIALQGVFPPRP
ncbi:MAG TPA: tail fiber protein [Rubricoccaceae bacterium]